MDCLKVTLIFYAILVLSKDALATDCYSYDTVNMEWFSSFSNYNLDPITCSTGNDICYTISGNITLKGLYFDTNLPFTQKGCAARETCEKELKPNLIKNMKERGYVPFNLTCTECSGNKCNGPTETNPGVSCYVCEECDEAFNSSVPLVKCSDWSTGCVKMTYIDKKANKTRVNRRCGYSDTCTFYNLFKMILNGPILNVDLNSTRCDYCITDKCNGYFSSRYNSGFSYKLYILLFFMFELTLY